MTMTHHDPFAGPEILLTAPTTESQREIWTSVQMGTAASLAFNESISLRFRGALDLRALEGALAQLVERHEALRMTFGNHGASLFVAAPTPFVAERIDLEALTAAEREAAQNKIFKAEVETLFELGKGPLFRAKLVRLAADEHLLVLTAHHIVCDGWSYAVILYDLGALYTAVKRGTVADLGPAEPFSRFAMASAAKLGGPENKRSEAYWLKQFERGAPVLDLPTDRPRPPRKTYSSLREDYLLNAALVQAVRKAGAKHGCSLVHTLMAGFNVLLHRLCGHEDLCVGLPAAGQAAADLKSLVGHCVNTLPIVSHLESEQKFSDYLRALKRTMLDAYDHQEFTYGSLLQKLKLPRDPSRLPLLSVLFNVDQKLDANKLGFEGVQVEFFSNPRHFENFELFINAVDSGNGLILEVQYNSDLFEGATVRRWMAMLETLLEAVTREPDAKLIDLPILPAAEQQRILLEWNATEAEYPRDRVLSDLVAAQAARTPERIAVVCGDARLSYRELDSRSNQLARRLRALGVSKGTLVGVAVERSVEMLVSLLGVLKAGGGYVPLDPAYPKDRLAYMMEHSRLPVLLTESHLVGELPEHRGQLLVIDKQAGEIARESAEAIAQVASPEDVAYVIYTSGSTGKPKGVMVPHRAVVNFLTSMSRKPGIALDDVLVAVTTLSFDIAVLELYLPLTAGAQVVIASRETAGDGHALLELLEASKATFMQATPATWRLLLEAGWKGSRHAGRPFKVLAGGEAVPRDLIDAILERTDTVWNMYGPTETAVWSTCNPIRTRTGAVSIGKPIDNTQVYILDARLRPTPVGVAGELHIGGAGVTHGYLHRPDLTAERFIENPYFNPFAKDLSPKLYKTGDLARFDPSGNIEYVGRNDGQVKVRGYRIELGEIETVLSQFQAVSQNVVMVREDRPGDVRLVAYVIARADQQIELGELRAHLRQSLPEYMVPQNFVVLESFPRTNNGKIERKALPAPTAAASVSENEIVEARTPIEGFLAELWKKHLGLEQVSITEDFFNLGGHSLLATRVMAGVSEHYSIDVSLKHMFEAPTIERQAALIVSCQGQTSAKELLAIAHREESGPAPLSLMQQRLWFVESISPGTCVYNLPAAFRFKGRFDGALFVKAFTQLLERHEALRTVLRETDAGPVQQVEPTPAHLLETVDLSSQPATTREQRMHELLDRLAKAPFDLTQGLLLRATLIRMADDDQVLFFMPHHAIYDGWSFDVVLRDLSELYSALEEGRQPELPSLAINYRDFTRWHRDFLSDERLAREMGGPPGALSNPLPALNLPVDRPRPAEMSFVGETHAIAFPKTTADRLTALARAEGATLFMALLASFKVLLCRQAGQDDVVIGSPIQGRFRPETEDLVGFFVNTLPLRTKLPREISFREALRRVRETCLGAFENQAMPFEKLVEELKPPRDFSRTPVFQAFFSFQDTTNRRSNLGSLDLSQVHLHSGVTPTDISFWVKETGQGITGAIDYCTALFDAATIARFAKQLEQLFEAVLKNPDAALSELPLESASVKSPIESSNRAVTESPLALSQASGLSLVEERLAAIWKEFLGVSHINRRDNFFDLGGHSLLAMRLITRVNKDFGVRLSVRAILLNTFEQLAALLPRPPEPDSETAQPAADQTSSDEPRTFFFGNPDSQLFGAYHPAVGGGRDHAVLLCYPIGHEYSRAHWAYRRLATQLSRGGFAVLRFDYRGTGDSFGAADEVLPENWVQDIKLAAREVKKLSGAKKISLVGARFGAILAATAADSELAADQLVFWDPVLNGAAYPKSLKKMHVEMLAYATRHPAPARPDELEEMLGHAYPLALQNSIAQAELEKTRSNAVARRVVTVVSEEGHWEEMTLFGQQLLAGPVLARIVSELKHEASK